jgi:psiF repeat-containing protein
MQYLGSENAGPTDFIHPRFSMAARRCVPLQPEVLPMMTLPSRVAAIAIASLFLMGSAFAETAAPANPAPAAMAKSEKPRSAASLECSKEADTKGIHGKERHKFMRQCKKDAKAGAATKQ